MKNILLICLFLIISGCDQKDWVPNFNSDAMSEHLLKRAMSYNPRGPIKTQEASNEDYIESKIDGDFNGWEGETVYKLINGQVWQQAEYTYSYSYSYMPRVIIFMKNGSYYMQVKNKKPVRVKLIG